MKRLLLAVSAISLLVGCGSTSKKQENYDHYFQRFFDRVKNPEKEYHFLDLYDAEDNRFKVEFLYEPHFHFGLKITEYAIYSVYHYPDEGVFSDDFERVTFELVESESAMFPAGIYVLSHTLEEGKNKFSLQANTITYELTTTKKDDPVGFDSGILGDYSYYVDDNKAFGMSVTAEKVDNTYNLYVSLEEDELEFEATNIKKNGKIINFTISGNQNGTYLKNGASAKFEYKDEGVEEETWILTLGNKKYYMEYGEGGHVDPKTGFFYDNMYIVSNSDFSLKMNMKIGELAVQVIINELVEGGKPNITTYFNIGDNGNSLTSAQNITGNMIFTSGNTYKFVHTVSNETDKIDLYKNGTLLYSNLTFSLLVF